MTQFQIACQTITFGEKQSESFDQVFSAVGSAGYTGCEIGFRHIRKHAPQDLKAMLASHNLVLAASHVGGNLHDPSGAKQEQSVLDEVLAYLDAIGTELLMYSGLKYESPEQFKRDFESLNRAAERCKGRLLYHNHDWEFFNNARVMEAILKDGSPHLRLCPDLGWVMKGGQDVIAFLERTKDRLGAIHFKDFATAQPGATDTVLLGCGKAPLAQAAKWICSNLKPIWIIAEQDNSDVPPAQAVTENAKFMRGLFR